MRALFLLFVLSFGHVSWAAEIPRDHPEDLVLQAAYNDTEFLAYACPDEQKCSLEDFGEAVDVEAVSLAFGASKPGRREFFVTPKTKGKQFPTLVFITRDKMARLVLSDYESGLSISRSGRNSMRDIVGLANPEPAMLVKTTYSWEGQRYIVSKRKCFKVRPFNGGKNTRLFSLPCG